MPRYWFVSFLVMASFVSVCASLVAQAGQRDLQKLTVGYTPISGATLPFFIAVEEKIFEKHGIEVSPVFMGGSPLVNSAILAGRIPHRIYRRRRGYLEPSRRERSDPDRIAAPSLNHRRLGKAGDQVCRRSQREESGRNPDRHVELFRRSVYVRIRRIESQ
jgi:hypothetical protein